jgi:hypothetical protein
MQSTMPRRSYCGCQSGYESLLVHLNYLEVIEDKIAKIPPYIIWDGITYHNEFPCHLHSIHGLVIHLVANSGCADMHHIKVWHFSLDVNQFGLMVFNEILVLQIAND